MKTVSNSELVGTFQDREIDIDRIITVLWAEKWSIILLTVVSAVISVFYSLQQTNIYRAEATLVAAEARQSPSPLVGQLGSAAALIGVNIGGQGGGQITNALAQLQSREFIRNFIQKHNLLVPLFASSWNPSTGSEIDRVVYNPETERWLLDSGRPTEQQAYKLFLSHLRIDQENTTGIINVAFEWPDPELAASWVNQLIFDINHEIKTADVQEASDAIAYLQRQLESTQLVDMQRVFYQLIESQTRITMLADVREEYVFKIIDPAVVPDQKIAPNRALIAIVGTILGFMMTMLFVLIRSSTRNSPSKL